MSMHANDRIERAHAALQEALQQRLYWDQRVIELTRWLENHGYQWLDSEPHNNADETD